jgi:FAD/FMN-containing dehydrogenase
VLTGARAYDAAVAGLVAAYEALPVGAPVRLAKRTSNLFRMRDATVSLGLDVSAFEGVLAIDAENRTADVLGMTTYESLVDATLPFGLMPRVVPQLKTITLGGAVTGLGIESSSFRNGCPHESVLELDVLTGDGRVLTVTPDGPHSDLFYGFPNSYGTLGYALRLRIELEPVKPFVELEHIRFRDPEACFAAVSHIAETGADRGRDVDFIDGVVFSGEELYLTLGRFVDETRDVSDYTRRSIYYKSIRQRTLDHLSIHDYLWRWDTDWFWCSGALGVQHPMVRPLLPRRLLRSDVYWKVVGFERRHGWKAAYDRKRGRPEREPVIQDVEVPVERAAEFLEFFQREIGISPVWLCPLRQRSADVEWDLYALEPATTYVNFGFWSSVAVEPGKPAGWHNRRIEQVVAELGGRKSLYSSSYYEPDEFWRTYNGDRYKVLKKEYDPNGRLLDLYAKCVAGR